MKKKVKKIPKYYQGVTAAGNINNPYLDKINTRIGVAPPAGLSKDNSAAAGGSGFGGNWGAFNAAATAGGKMLMNAFGVDDNSQAGVTLNSSMQGAEIGGSIMPGWGHLIGGVAGGMIGAVKKGSVDENTGEITSGGIFGHSMGYLRRKSNMIKNSIQSRTQTQNLQADYYNENPTGSINVLASEGGIMRKPVDALVSKGELIYNPVTKKLSQVPGSKGKPNKADDVYTRLYEGDVVISNSPTMLMSNGKTPAQNLMGMVDKYSTGGTVKAREAIIKKVVNWQEANKTKPQEYAKFSEGDPGFFSYLMSNRTRPIDAVISEYMKQYGKTAKEFKGYDGSDQSFLQGLQNIITANNKYVLPIRFKGGKSFDQVRSLPISSAVEFNPEYWDYYSQQSKPNNTSNANVVKLTKPLWQPTENIGITTHPEIDNVWSRHKTSDFAAAEIPVTTVPTVSKKKQETTVSKKGEVSKPSSGKKTATSLATTSTVPQEEKLTPEQIAESLRIADIGERHWLRGSVTEPKQSFTSLAKITPEKIKSQGIDNVAPLTGIKPSTDTTGTDNTGYTGSNWRDGLYRMAVLSQPLWDRAEAEPVNYESPVYKYMPTAIDVSSQLRDADQSYALSRYNFANLYPNTGAGMAAGLQAASNRAKQYADIRQWQTNAQNELIGKNVGIYNNWANEHARIMNDVYNKTAANRAAARNINRQNRAAALSNYGQMLKDDKQFAMDTMKLQMMEPMMQYGYENYNDYLNWKKANGYG